MDEKNNKTKGEEVEEPKQTEKTEERDKSRLSVEKIRRSINENKPAVLGGVFLVLILVAASTASLSWGGQKFTPDPVTAPFDDIDEGEESGLPKDMEDTEEAEFLFSDENDVEDVDQGEDDELDERPMGPFTPDPVIPFFDDIDEEEEIPLPEDIEDTEDVEYLPSDGK